jgi:undecaprenyl-diphosphatase
MTILHGIILGIIEGITEFLPISSTGHLILASELLKIAQSDFVKSFEVIIQFGAILSVVVLYWKQLFNVDSIKKLIVGFIPTGIIGLALYGIVKTYLFGNQAVVLWSLLVGGVLLIAFEMWHERKEREVGATASHPSADTTGSSAISGISDKQSFIIGLCQSVAIIPGVSRSAATIVGGLALGLKRKTIVEFSFLLAVPTMLAATGLDLVKNADSFSADQFGVLAVGFIVSFIVATASIKFLLGYVRKHNFVAFGIYRIIAALVFWLIIF